MASKSYDDETMEHVNAVRAYMERAGSNIFQRARVHDESKFEEPERSGFQRIAALSETSNIEYGSQEYRDRLKQEKPTIDHHYAHNDHHPEYWLTHEPPMCMYSAIEPDPVKNGKCISSMSLMSIIEMICDWKAASFRYKDGSFARTFPKNCERFGIEGSLKSVIWNTAVELGIVTRDGQDV